MAERIQLVGEIPEPRHWPLRSMAEFGKIPGREENLFRIVWAPSVKTLIGGQFSDGFVGYKVRPAYRVLHDVWVLEKWISAAECTHQTEAAYNADPRNRDFATNLYKTGPYPKNGTYFLCHAFPGETPDININLLVSLIKKAKLNSATENARAIQETVEKEDRADDVRRFEQVKDAQSAFGVKPFSSLTGVHSQAKSTPTPKLVPVEQMRLPTHGPALMGRGQKMNVMQKARPEFTEHQLSLIGR